MCFHMSTLTFLKGNLYAVATASFIIVSGPFLVTYGSRQRLTQTVQVVSDWPNTTEPVQPMDRFPGLVYIL